ncbi:MAG: hypothetical protein HYT10_03230 [Candidatus Levybacteria bacterium]|nr:hypothetical protein [Candidatus Levybacteria bacterium]
MLEALNSILARFWQSFVNFLPNFFGGLLILFLGLILAGVLRSLLVSIFTFVRFDRFFEKTRLVGRQETKVWQEVLTEVVRWTVILLFLVPTLEVWGFQRATVIVNEFILYLPNVIIAVVMGFVGVVLSNLAADVVRSSVRSLRPTSANALAVLAKSAIVFFTALVVLNQLGVAQELIRILFTGIVGMLAIAGGLAFGLGGKEAAKDVLDDLKRNIKQ